jgi:hypothetical protein
MFPLVSKIADASVYQIAVYAKFVVGKNKCTFNKIIFFYICLIINMTIDISRFAERKGVHPVAEHKSGINYKVDRINRTFIRAVG